MTDQQLLEKMKAGINTKIMWVLDNPLLQKSPELKEMLAYQLGMDDAPGSSFARGKRLRPLLLLLSTHAAGGDWKQALSAAAAVELMHNFSLIHDDIQDKSEMRRGRQTVWVKWGTAQAINAGDAMLGLAQLALLEDAVSLKKPTEVRLIGIFNETLVKLTAGQYMDLAFEKAVEIAVADYDLMVAGKTGALLEACFTIGAIIGRADFDTQEIVAQAGRAAGRAFQIQDDWLGIWGREKDTGKSVYSDLMERKKTFPVIRGLQANEGFARLWRQLDSIGMEDAERLSDLLDKEGVKNETEQAFALEYRRTLDLIGKMSAETQQVQPLVDLIQSILSRMK